ncbi:hypothetical protein CW304_13780 [Bacillus sp. UFRGS-B20]|nr:hypothetical protein CW304_13780 [Bacillus sp. UFRGS-B20]
MNFLYASFGTTNFVNLMNNCYILSSIKLNATNLCNTPLIYLFPSKLTHSTKLISSTIILVHKTCHLQNYPCGFPFIATYILKFLR